MRKNILFDIPNISKKNGGTYQYSIALLNLIGKNLSNFNFYVYSIEPEEDIQLIIEKYSHLTLVQVPKPTYAIKERIKHRFIQVVQKTTGFSRKLYTKDIYNSIIEKYNIDIVHTPFQSLVRRPGIKSITTLHDVQELYFPQFFSSAQRAYRAVNFKKFVDGADAVIVSYDHVRNDIVKFFDKPSQMVHTILLNMENLWFKDFEQLNSNSIDHFGLPSKFLLYPAATWEHKNHLRLLEAINELEINDIFLVCTGNKTDYYYKKIEPLVEELGFKERVKFLGIVSDEELFNLYKKCQAVVVPTLYEAGSFPLMESIIMNIPVVCSNVTSLPETIGEKKYTFDPYDVKDISDKIEKIWTNKQYRNDNLVVLHKQAEILQNNDAANKLKRIYLDL